MKEEGAYKVPPVVKVSKKKPPRHEVPGVKTSEFWLTLGAMCFPILDATLGWGLPTDKILAAVIAVGAYTASRGIAKRGAGPSQTQEVEIKK